MQQIPLNILAVLCNHYWMEQHLIPTLRSAFQNVEVFFYEGMAKWYDPNWVEARPAEMKRFLATVRSLRTAGKLDLIFMVVYDDFLFPSVAAAIKNLGIRMVNYHVDMPTQWYRCIKTARYFDLIGVAHNEHFADLSSYGAKLVYVPMAANVEHFRPLNHKKEYDVLFIGSFSPPRADVLSAATDVTNSVYIAGGGWEGDSSSENHIPVKKNSWQKNIHDLNYIVPRLLAEGFSFYQTRNLGDRIYPKGGRTGGAHYLGRPDDIVELINKSRIVLGINQRFGSLGSRNGCIGSRLRDFEAPSCGTMYLVQRYPELGIHYIENEEVVAWSDLKELRKKIAYYLSHEKEREAIAAKGRARVIRTHQWEHRYRAMISHLNENSY